ncbi:MAG TPA: hypothetical protein VHE80_10540, partial [Acidimicrobiales bacterium]|nr:hypothetical protein [Acidimicrobiales bacterium]
MAVRDGMVRATPPWSTTWMVSRWPATPVSTRYRVKPVTSSTDGPRAPRVGRDRLSYRALRTLGALGPSVEEVTGFTRYRVETGV